MADMLTCHSKLGRARGSVGAVTDAFFANSTSRIKSKQSIVTSHWAIHFLPAGPTVGRGVSILNFAKAVCVSLHGAITVSWMASVLAGNTVFIGAFRCSWLAITDALFGLPWRWI